MNLENRTLTGSGKFLSNLIDKRVLVVFKDFEERIGTLIWDDEHTIGVRFILSDGADGTEDVLYYKSFIKSIKEK